MAKRRPQCLRITLQAGNSLAVALFDVIFERHGSRADVGALFHCVLSSLAAQVRQAELVAHFADEIAAIDLDALFVLEEAERFANNLKRQTEKLGEVAADHGPARIDRTEDH